MSNLSIVKRIAAKLKLGDEGKLDNFFQKQISKSEKAIRDLKRNKVTLENEYNDNVEDLKDKLVDATDNLKAAYDDVVPENVSSNSAAADFESIYWSRIEDAKYVVESLKSELEEAKDEYEADIKDIDEQIAAYQERIDALK